MAEVNEIHPPHEGSGNFFTNKTGPLPNWGWMLVIVAGIGIAYFLPKFLGGGSTSSTNPDTTGLGLAIDPTTGLPYAVSGLVPTGGVTTVTPPPIVQPPTNVPPTNTGFNFPGMLPGIIQTINGQWTCQAPQCRPLIPQKEWRYGSQPTYIHFAGQEWTVVPGAGGRQWGVPGHMSEEEAKESPIKTLLFAPSSYYPIPQASNSTSPLGTNNVRMM